MPIKKIVFLLFVILLAACSSDEPQNKNARINAGDIEVMRELYDAFNLSVKDPLYAWGSVVNDTCKNSWQGVTFELDPVTNEFRVSGIELAYIPENMNVTLPESMSKLSHLKSFILFAPDNFSLKLSEGLCECPLEVLKIEGYYNYSNHKRTIFDSCPSNFSNLSKTLRILRIYDTTIGNSLLPHLQYFNKLEVCFLQFNNFTGKVPLSLKNVSCKVDMYKNHFSEFDWGFLECQPMQIPDLDGNNITGPLPLPLDAKHPDMCKVMDWLIDNPIYFHWAKLYFHNPNYD